MTRPASLKKCGRIGSFFFIAVVLSAAVALQAQPYAAQRLTAAGTPEEIGAAVGARYAPVLRQLHPTFLALGELTGATRTELYAKAATIAEHLSPEDVREIRAVARASELRYEDVLYLNLFYNITAGQRACRQIALWGSHTTGGQLLHARNLDWIDYPGEPLKKNNLILDVKPRDGIEYVMLTWPGLEGALTGTNRAGLTVGFNTLPGESSPRASEPTFFTLKRVLRSCRTIEQAVALIRRAKPMGNGSVLISSSQESRAVVVEIVGDQIGVRQAREAMIGNANHPTREAGLKGLARVGPADEPTCRVAREMDRKFDAESLPRVMADPRVLASVNLLSVVFDPSANRMWLACGQMPAALGKFEEFKLFEN